jgi:hypothetical protein
MATIEGTLAAAGRQYGDSLNQMGMVPGLVLQSFAKLLEDIEDRKMRREQMAQQESQFSRQLAEMVNERTQRGREGESARTLQRELSEKDRAQRAKEHEDTTSIARDNLAETKRLHDETAKLQKRIQDLAEKTQDASQKQFYDKMAAQADEFNNTLNSRMQEFEFSLGEKAADRIAAEKLQTRELESRERIAKLSQEGETASGAQRANTALYATAREGFLADLGRVSQEADSNSPRAGDHLAGVLGRLAAMEADDVGGEENLAKLRNQIHSDAKSRFPDLYARIMLRDVQRAASGMGTGPTLQTPKGQPATLSTAERRTLESGYRSTPQAPESYRGYTISPEDSAKLVQGLGTYMKGLSDRYATSQFSPLREMAPTTGSDTDALQMEALAQYLQPTGQPVEWRLDQPQTRQYGHWAPRNWPPPHAVDLTRILDEIRQAQLRGESETDAALRLLNDATQLQMLRK